MKTGYSGIIFDFNGTLFFDSDKQEESWEIISMRLRGRAFGKQEMQRRMHGRSGKSTCSNATCPTTKCCG